MPGNSTARGPGIGEVVATGAKTHFYIEPRDSVSESFSKQHLVMLLCESLKTVI